MRFREFTIAEAKINIPDFQRRNSHYWRNILKMISQSIPIKIGASGSNVVTIDEAEQTYNMLAAIWDGEDLATSEQLEQLKKVLLTTTDGDTIKVSEIYKSPEIKGGVEAKTKFWNLGNIVEGIMGAAVTAKFESPKKETSEDDLFEILSKLKAGIPETPKKGKKDPLVPYSYETKSGNDIVTFTLSLNANDFNALMMSVKDPKELKEYPSNEEIFRAFKDAANYVNTSNTVKTAIDRVNSDPNKNTVIIESEGGSAEKQTSTKADLFITIDGVRERLLSLKSKTVPQIGQVSGHAFDNVDAFFKSIVGINVPNTYRDLFPEGNFQTVGRDIFEKGHKAVYQYIFKVLKGDLKGDNDNAEYDLIKQVYDGIVHHATLGEDVIVVYLSPSAKKAYTELRFGNDLLAGLQDFDLRPELASPTTLKIVGYPVTELGRKKTNSKPLDLVQMRSYISAGKNVRNIVEVGALLKVLANIEQPEFNNPTTPADTAPVTPTSDTTDELTSIKKNAGIIDKRQF